MAENIPFKEIFKDNIDNVTELIDARNINSKLIVDILNNEKHLIVSNAPIHYQNGDKLLDQNLKFKKTSYGWKIDEAFQEVRLPEYSDGEFWIGKINSKVVLKIKDISKVKGDIEKEKSYYSPDRRRRFKDSGNKILYEDVFQSTDLKYFCEGYGTYKMLYLKDNKCPRNFTFEIDLGTNTLDNVADQESKTMVSESDISILRDKDGKEIGKFAYPFIKTIERRTFVPSRKITQLGNGKINIDINIPEEFIEKAQFPLQLDPSLTAGAVGGGTGEWNQDGNDDGSHPGASYVQHGLGNNDCEAVNWHEPGDGPPYFRHYHNYARGFYTFNISGLNSYINPYVTSATIYIYINDVFNDGGSENAQITRIPYHNNTSQTAFNACSDGNSLGGGAGWHSRTWTSAVRTDVGGNYHSVGIKQPSDVESHWTTSETWRYPNQYHVHQQLSASSYVDINFTATPFQITGLTITNLYDNRFRLNWNSDSLATAYYIDRYDPVNGWITNWSNTTSTYYIDSTIYQDIGYYYRVRGYNSSHPVSSYRWGAYSNQVYGINTISAPNTVHATNLYTGDVRIDWTLNETYYTHSKIQRNVNSGGWVDLITFTAGTNTYQDPNVPMNVLIQYRVRFERNTYNGANSTYTQAPETITSSVPPVNNLIAVNDDRYNNVISFDPILLPYTYVSLERRFNGGSWLIISNLLPGTYTFLDTDIYPQENKYEYRARTYHSSFPSPYGNYTLSVPSYLNLSKEAKLRKYFINDTLKFDT